MLLTIIIFVVVLGLLVFVHELGHFSVARWNGIKAEEFGFGFPPRIGGVFYNERTKKWEFVRGNREVASKNTVYSVNWIPFGGFVRIKGEDGSGAREPDSFAAQSGWKRIQVLAAGVVMNFLLAWALLSAVLMMGFPQTVDPDDSTLGGKQVDIQIQRVLPGTPAEQMGLRMGDDIVTIDGVSMTTLNQVQEYISTRKGQQITVKVDRGGRVLALEGTPRTDYPAEEGSLGIVFAAAVTTQYGPVEAVKEGGIQTYRLTGAMLSGLWQLVSGQGSISDVSGPVGIAEYTRQASDLGLVYLLFFAAVLSINLGIINILPFPALDGGRVLFVLIEMLRGGKPVSQRIEGLFHQFGFLLLITLMLVVTVHDVLRMEFFNRLF